jgi:hypothetical protein
VRSTIHGPGVYLLKSKKPYIIDLIARAEAMTDDEIRALPEKPDVIKGLLDIRKMADQRRAASVAERLADMMISAYNK